MSFWPAKRLTRNNDLMGLQKEMNHFFDSLGRDTWDLAFPKVEFNPSIEVREDEKVYTVKAEVPGMTENDIKVTLKDNTLILEGEKRNEVKKEEKRFYHSEISYGSFYRAIPFAKEIKDENVSAVYKDGVLNVTLEKATNSSTNGRNISIKKS